MIEFEGNKKFKKSASLKINWNQKNYVKDKGITQPKSNILVEINYQIYSRIIFMSKKFGC